VNLSSNIKRQACSISSELFQDPGEQPEVLKGTWTAYRNICTRGLISEVVKEMIFVAISGAKNVRTAKLPTLHSAAFCK